MRKVVRKYGVILFGPEVSPLERVTWKEVVKCDASDFRPMSFWVWADIGCIVHSLAIAGRTIVDTPMPATVFARPPSFRIPQRPYWPERMPLGLESAKARDLFEKSVHAFTAPERVKGPFRVEALVEGPFRAGGLFGDWYVPVGGDDAKG